jgi:hypothetical protein
MNEHLKKYEELYQIIQHSRGVHAEGLIVPDLEEVLDRDPRLLASFKSNFLPNRNDATSEDSGKTGEMKVPNSGLVQEDKWVAGNDSTIGSLGKLGHSGISEVYKVTSCEPLADGDRCSI